MLHPFRFDTAQSGEASIPSPIRHHPNPSANPIRRLLYSYLKYWSGEGGRRRRSFPLLPFQPFDPPPPQPTALPLLSRGSHLLLEPSPYASLLLPFAKRRGKKKEPGKRKERKEGMSWLERGESFRGRWFLPSLSLSRARSNRVSTRWCSRIGFTVHLVYREERNCTSLSI